MSTSLTISIKSLGHDTVSVTIPRTYSVLELKSKLQSLFYIDRKRQRLLFQGKILKDERKLLDYDNLENGKMIHLIITAGDSETDEPRINTIITLEPHLTTQNLLPIPTLLEMRLTRTISYISNLRNILQIPIDQLDLSRQLHMLPSSLRSMRQTHSALRQDTTHPNEQIALVMEQMADAMDLTSPWLKEVAENKFDHEIIENKQLSIGLRTARILQIMSLIYCFLGSAMDLSEPPTNQEQPRSKKQKLNHHC